MPEEHKIRPFPPLKKGERCRKCTQRAGSLCEVLTCDELDKLDEIMVWVHAAPGQTIFNEGDKLENYFNVSQGIIRLIKILPDGRRVVLDFLFKGDFLGLDANGKYAYSAEAATQVKLCRFPRKKLQKMFRETPKLEQRLLTMFSEKLVSTQTRIADLACKSPPERLAAFLLDFEKKEGLKTKNGVVTLPVSREDIADYLGLTIWTISRIFSRFKKEGLIKIDKRRTIYLENKIKLRNLANGS